MKDPAASIPIKVKLPLGFVILFLCVMGVGGVFVINSGNTPLNQELLLRLRSEVITLIIFICLPMITALFLVVQYIIRPLSELQKMALRIKEGDFSARNTIQTEDEIGILARTSNLMAEAIEDRTMKLEQAANNLKQSEQDLRMQHNLLNTVINTMTDGLILMNFQGQTKLSNKAAEPLLKVINKANGHLHIKKCDYHKEEGDECISCICDPGRHTSCVLTVNKEIYEILSTKVPSLYGSSKVLVARNITERELMRRQQAHQEQLAVLGKLAAVVAHEINNPLSAISMYNQMMESELPEASPFQEHVDVIKRNTEMCQYITRSLLDCARMPQPKMQATDLHALLENVVRFIRSIHKKTNIKIETAFQEADAVCWGDVAQLQQVFVNLLVNADQAIDKDGGTIRLRTTESDDGFIVVDVIDNGPGIGVNHIDNIFEPFYTTKSIGGTGLGLPTSRQIVEAHQGSLTLLVSSPDRTIFRVTLPKTRSQPSEPFIQVDMPEQGVSIER